MQLHNIFTFIQFPNVRTLLEDQIKHFVKAPHWSQKEPDFSITVKQNHFCNKLHPYSISFSDTMQDRHGGQGSQGLVIGQILIIRQRRQQPQGTSKVGATMAALPAKSLLWRPCILYIVWELCSTLCILLSSTIQKHVLNMYVFVQIKRH